jgi:hypothetical protein
LASPSHCKIPSGVQLPPAAALRRSLTRAEGHRHFRAIHALVGIRSTFAVPSSANHPNIRTLSGLFAAPTLECSDVRLGWQETRNRVLECALVCGRLAASLSRSGRLNVSVATPSEISSISCFSIGCSSLMGTRVAQGPYDVARRASCAPLSWASTNSARRPQTNAH